MTTIVTRAGKGSPLTNTEMDTNLTNLNSDKTEVTTLAAAGGAALVGNTPAGSIAATTVQAAINELDAEKALLNNVAPDTHAASSKATPVDADELPLADSATSFSLKKLTWANIKNTLITTANNWTSAQTFSADTSVVSLNGGQLAGFRNRVINGGMQISQRGTNFVNCLNAYTIDRWRAFGGPSNITISQVAQPYTVSTSGYGMRFGRTAGETLTNNIGIHYSMETKDSWGLVNKTVTLSFRCQKGANFSSSGNVLNFTIVSGTGTDEKSTGYTGGVSINSSAAITSSPVTYTVTGTIPTTATEVGVLFNYTPTGTAGANDYVDICDVQLEVGSVATPFEQRPYGTELALCQRYFSKTFPQATAPAQNAGTLGSIYFGQIVVASTTMGEGHRFPVTMRATPTIVLYNPNAANAQIRNNGTGTDFTGTGATNIDQNGIGITGISPAGSVTGQTCLLHCTADAEL